MHIPTVLQFGTSRFLQAHADLFLSEAFPGERPVTVVQTSGDPSRASRAAAMAQGYDVRIRGLQDGAPLDETRHVTSVARGLTLGPDLAEVTQLIAGPVDMILSNTADAGFRQRPEDAAPRFDPAMSYPAKLAHLLRHRFDAGGAPIQVMPTELVRNNGAVLRDLVLTVAQRMDRPYRDWLAGEVTWVNSLVDRIVSEPLEPAGGVAEPYALWAIEAQPGLVVPCDHPDIDVVQDLGRVERRKLFVLNLGHTWIISAWLAQGRTGAVYVRDVMENADWAAQLQELYETEVLPGFAAAGEIGGLADYIATTLERFANPFLDHRLEDIAQNHDEKLQRRIAAFIQWARGNGDTGTKPRLTAALEGKTT
ncbi:mannitol dehydrogenase family protein [Chachezhania antarctica]|uniref:mannitol dehydrogenase family protein n=1 Tax=Chachezhania antarctica TaxID=2340860 RepID=UPI0019692872|nr:mannitol dehydrogenase family protein [Chachezhania antarctica]|tara:strand:+ start:6008 stop:7105 length:1098 start_codon:yes stop_codon:yes gene_type:complete